MTVGMMEENKWNLATVISKMYKIVLWIGCGK